MKKRKITESSKIIFYLSFLYFALFSSFLYNAALLIFVLLGLIQGLFSGMPLSFLQAPPLLFFLYVFLPIIVIFFFYKYLFTITDTKKFFLGTLFILLTSYGYSYPINTIISRNPFLLLFLFIFVVLLSFIITMMKKNINQITKKQAVMFLSIPLAIISATVLWDVFSDFFGSIINISPPTLEKYIYYLFITFGTFFIDKTHFAFNIYYLDWGGFVILVYNSLLILFLTIEFFIFSFTNKKRSV